MTDLTSLRDTIRGARVASRRPGMTDPVVHALVALADLTVLRISAQERLEDAAFSGDECGATAREFAISDSRLRFAIDAPITDRSRAAELPVVVLHESWFQRAVRWLSR